GGTFAGARELERENAFADRSILLAILGEKRETNCARAGKAGFLSKFRQAGKQIRRIERSSLPRLSTLNLRIDRFIQNRSDLCGATVVLTHIEKKQSIGAPFPLIGSQSKPSSVLDRSPGNAQCPMTAWPDIASGIPYRAYFLFVGEIDIPD